MTASGNRQCRYKTDRSRAEGAQHAKKEKVSGFAPVQCRGERGSETGVGPGVLSLAPSPSRLWSFQGVLVSV
jgi:hypothetical protein